MTPVSSVKTVESYVVCLMGHYLGSTYTGTDRNERASNRTGPDCAGRA